MRTRPDFPRPGEITVELFRCTWKDTTWMAPVSVECSEPFDLVCRAWAKTSTRLRCRDANGQRFFITLKKVS